MIKKIGSVFACLVLVMISHANINGFSNERMLDSIILSYQNQIKVTDNDSIKGRLYKRITIECYQSGHMLAAARFARHSLKHYKQFNDTACIGRAYSNMGNVYFGMDSCDKALQYYTNAMILSEQSNDSIGMCMGYLNKGACMHLLGKYQTAENMFRTSLGIAQQMSDTTRVLRSMDGMIATFNERKLFDSSTTYINKVVHLCESNSDLDLKRSAYLNASETYKAIGQLDSALHYSNLSYELLDSINTIKRFSAIQKIETAAAVKVKDAQIKTKNWMLAVLVAMLIMAVIAMLFIMYLYRLKERLAALAISKNDDIVRVTEAVRQSTSRQLRGIMNYLAPLSMLVLDTKKFDLEIKELVVRLFDDLRTAQTSMHHPEQFPNSLRELELDRQVKFTVDFSAIPASLSSKVQLGVYRITQALKTSLKEVGATVIIIGFEPTAKGITLVTRANTSLFKPNAVLRLFLDYNNASMDQFKEGDFQRILIFTPYE